MVFLVKDERIISANVFATDSIVCTAGADATGPTTPNTHVITVANVTEDVLVKMLNKGTECGLSAAIDTSINAGAAKNALLALINTNESTSFTTCEYVFSIASFLTRCATTIADTYDADQFSPGEDIEFKFTFKSLNSVNAYYIVIKTTIVAATPVV